MDLFRDRFKLRTFKLQSDYEGKISRVQAKKLAYYYLQERIHNGSNIKIIFDHGKHVFNVAKIAEAIALHSKGRLDADTAYSLGLLHDIGRIKDETVTKVPHGIEGFNYLTEHGYPDLAPICLTHGFLDKNIKAEDFPTYSSEQLNTVKTYLQTREYNDYDYVIQLADLFSRGAQIMTIHQRLEKNKQFYHLPEIPFEKKAYEILGYINTKYQIDVEQIVADLFAPSKVQPTIGLSFSLHTLNAAVSKKYSL